MIQVTVIYNNKNKIVSIESKGHAESGPYGHDLVCAGVSAIVTGGLNNITRLELDMYNIELDSGHFKIEPFDRSYKINHHDSIVLETIFIQLETIAAEYPKNISIQKLHK